MRTMLTLSMFWLLLVSSAAVVLAGEPASPGWSQWAGPTRNWRTTDPSGQWPPKKLWEKGFGESDNSPIIVGGRIYVSTLVNNKTAVRCIEAATGKVLWEGTTPGGRWGRFHAGDEGAYVGPLSTPACDGTRLFTLSIDGDLQCWDAKTGEKGWGFNLYDKYKEGRRKSDHDYGVTTSPMLLGDNVLLEVGGDKGAVMAFRKTDGSEAGAWGKGQGGHSSGPSGADGKVYLGINALWIKDASFPWSVSYSCCIPMPGFDGDYVVATSSYNISKTCCYLDGKLKWESRINEKVHSPVVDVKHSNVYLPGVGQCISLEKGERKWSFGNSTGVILTGDEKLIVFGSSLRLFDLQGKKLSEVPGIPSNWSTGAFADGTIVCKSRDKVVVFSVR
jgi:outer membrane protein assembly factor BamB